MKKIFRQILVVISLISISACSDLEPEVLDEALNSDLLEGAGAAEGILAPVYGRMNQLFNSHEDWFLIQEITTDEAMVPYRGGTDWFNGGILIEAYRHTWTPTHNNLRNVWNQLVQGVARSAIAVNTISGLDNANGSAYIAEARAMGAFYNYCLLDAYGVCLYKDPANIYSSEKSQILRGAEAVEFLLSELDAVEAGLKTKTEVGAGRFTKAAAWALKARIYLNKAVYTDRYAAIFNFAASDMQKAIENCDKVISSGEYSLESGEYFSIFNMDNHNHKEHIFAIDHRDDANNAGRMTWFSLARNQHFSLTNLVSTGTDGGSVTSDYYNTWKDNTDDPRFFKEYIKQDGTQTSIPDAAYKLNRGFLQGQQYGIALNPARTAFKRAANGELVVEKLFNTQRTGEAVNFTIAVDLETNNGHSSGVRVSKYEVDPRSTNGRNYSRVDQPLMRIGEIYLTRAEAKLRSGDRTGALADINAIRTARRHPRQMTAAELSLDNIYRERGYELYWEMVRRTDMVRFGKFEDTYTSKTNKDIYRRIFPIPQATIDADPSFLQQNQGY